MGLFSTLGDSYVDDIDISNWSAIALRGASRTASLARLAEGQVDPTGSKGRMPPLLQRLHAVESEPRRAAPDHDVSMGQRDSARAVGAAVSAEQEYRRQPQ